MAKARNVKAIMRMEGGLCRLTEVVRTKEGVLTNTAGEPLSPTGEMTKIAGWGRISRLVSREVYRAPSGNEYIILY